MKRRCARKRFQRSDGSFARRRHTTLGGVRHQRQRATALHDALRHRMGFCKTVAWEVGITRLGMACPIVTRRSGFSPKKAVSRA